jgi:Alcohol dehydrogenase GroES-like domain
VIKHSLEQSKRASTERRNDMKDTTDAAEMGDTMDAPHMGETMGAPRMGETMDAPMTSDGMSGHAINGTMKAVSQDELGGPDVLKLVRLPIPEPGVSEILIRVHAASVNPIDGANRETGAFVGEPPFVLGWDVCGSVEAVGPGVTLYKALTPSTSSVQPVPSYRSPMPSTMSTRRPSRWWG